MIKLKATVARTHAKPPFGSGLTLSDLYTPTLSRG